MPKWFKNTLTLSQLRILLSVFLNVSQFLNGLKNFLTLSQLRISLSTLA